MPRQSAVTVHAPLPPDAVPAVVELLRQIRAEGESGVLLPLASLPGVHFARVFVLEQVGDPDGATIAPSLVYMSDVDLPQHRHLQDLATVAGHGLDALFGRSPDYPAEPSVEDRVGWLSAHALSPAAVYVHTRGRSLQQVRDEARLREELEKMTDDDLGAGRDALAVHARLREQVRSRPDLAWALHGADRSGAPTRLVSIAMVAGLAVLAIVLLPLLLALLVVFLVAIRLHERRDVAETGAVDPKHVHDVEQYEDWATQNPFTAIGFVKAGLVRRVTMRVALAGLDFANRRFFARNTLAGVRTLHFARWVPLDDGRRLVFASSYDGSQESYMNDFIDRLAWGLNLVFSNGVGYPSTRWLLFGGAHDELAFKRYLRRHQVPTVVWFSAYPTLHAPKVDANAALREGLRLELDQPQAERWVASL
ncbi:hypothetical protein ACPPVT_16125 [Angustibacter sp. McL0619]|uniref:hypothetical protein n=1 Tax=Angustibacter sp. McL0619 TaxID=3415676 RepID=UPI003CEE3969